MSGQFSVSSKRPPLLSALCLLTFIGSTTAFVGYFLAAVLFNRVGELVLKFSSWHSTKDISPLFFTMLMVFYSLSLIGAIRMWKLHRDGFFLYTFSQLLILLLPAVWINWNAFSFTNLIFILVFVAGYALNLKNMR